MMAANTVDSLQDQHDIAAQYIVVQGINSAHAMNIFRIGDEYYLADAQTGRLEQIASINSEAAVRAAVAAIMARNYNQTMYPNGSIVSYEISNVIPNNPHPPFTQSAWILAEIARYLGNIKNYTHVHSE
jgi:hypothetical protein